MSEPIAWTPIDIGTFRWTWKWWNGEWVLVESDANVTPSDEKGSSSAD